MVLIPKDVYHGLSLRLQIELFKRTSMKIIVEKRFEASDVTCILSHQVIVSVNISQKQKTLSLIQERNLVEWVEQYDLITLVKRVIGFHPNAA
jgi:hypothetical protein